MVTPSCGPGPDWICAVCTASVAPAITTGASTAEPATPSRVRCAQSTGRRRPNQPPSQPAVRAATASAARATVFAAQSASVRGPSGP
jgi:hypothetical protein